MSMIDRLLARQAELEDAAARAAEAVMHHGDGAEEFLQAKLGDPRRRRSRRSIRLAIEMVRTKH